MTTAHVLATIRLDNGESLTVDVPSEAADEFVIKASRMLGKRRPKGCLNFFNEGRSLSIPVRRVLCIEVSTPGHALGHVLANSGARRAKTLS